MCGALTLPIRPTGQIDPEFRLTGPAVDALTGGPARHPFSLDSGGLTVAPPRAGDGAEVSGATAQCAALASTEAGGGSFAQEALNDGMAFGLARVTVRDDVKAGPGPVDEVPDSEDVLPAPALPAPYDDRLAWVAVVRQVLTVPCPAGPAGGARSAQPTVATDYNYQVFLVDAATGADALVYTEGGPNLCGAPGRYDPTLSVPTDDFSASWTLTGRNANGYAATITAQLRTCDGYQPVVTPDEQSPALIRVLVQRPIGPPCGSPVARTLTLHAATVTADLPATLVHAPTGIYPDVVVS